MQTFIVPGTDVSFKSIWASLLILRHIECFSALLYDAHRGLCVD